jgi:hypothetical protein
MTTAAAEADWLAGVAAPDVNCLFLGGGGEFKLPPPFSVVSDVHVRTKSKTYCNNDGAVALLARHGGRKTLLSVVA